MCELSVFDTALPPVFFPVHVERFLGLSYVEAAEACSVGDSVRRIVAQPTLHNTTSHTQRG